MGLRYPDIKIPDNQSSISSEELLRQSRENSTTFHGGVKDDIEKLKLIIMQKGLIKNQMERNNWNLKTWCGASGWEADYARYLLIERLTGGITLLMYEPFVFDFKPFLLRPCTGETTGTSRYKPDFLIRYNGEWAARLLEVKGRFRPGDIGTIRNLFHCYPRACRKMVWGVEAGKATHEKICNWTWINYDSRWIFYKEMKSQLADLGY